MASARVHARRRRHRDGTDAVPGGPACRVAGAEPGAEADAGSEMVEEVQVL
jgi:hypothetical protein